MEPATSESDRVAKAAAGRAQFAELTREQREAAHASIDRRIAHRVAATQFGRPATLDEEALEPL